MLRYDTIRIIGSDGQGLRCCRVLVAALVVLSFCACASLEYKTGMVDYKIGAYGPAVAYFNRAAKAGNPEAQNMLGWYWANGIGRTPKNVAQACNWYAKAADQGLPDAINNLALCYECPCIAQRDMNKAIALYTLAARKGNAKAQMSLARLGQPVPSADLVPRQPTKVTQEPVATYLVPQTAPQAAQAARGPPQLPEGSESSGGGLAALGEIAEVAVAIFAASKSYSTTPTPVFIPPPVSVHCTTQVLNQMALTNCN
jgi:hypothetical protein